jgi:hypothetical protein
MKRGVKDGVASALADTGRPTVAPTALRPASARRKEIFTLNIATLLPWMCRFVGRDADRCGRSDEGV